jgi:hypothetical protein
MTPMMPRRSARQWSSVGREGKGDGFEGALSDLQLAFEREPSGDNRVALETLEAAVAQLFADMNAGFFQPGLAVRPSRFGHFLQTATPSGCAIDAVAELSQSKTIPRCFHEGAEARKMPCFRRPSPKVSNSWRARTWGIFARRIEACRRNFNCE